MVFNLIGYRLVFSYLQGSADTRMVEKIDKLGYDKATLTEVKVPLHLPYPVNDKNFERYDGSIEINGVIYNYVERKQQNDTLILHCIPNIAASDVKAAGKEYSKSINDPQPLQKGQKGNAVLLLKALECAGYRFTNYTALNNLLDTREQTAYKTANETIISDNFSTSPEQPPDAA